MPDGTPRKLMDVSKLKTEGWEATTTITEGLKLTYQWFLENLNNFKEVKMKRDSSLRGDKATK